MSDKTLTIEQPFLDRMVHVLERVENFLSNKGPAPPAEDVRELRKDLLYPTPELRVEAFLREARSQHSDLFEAISDQDLNALGRVLDNARKARRFEFHGAGE